MNAVYMLVIVVVTATTLAAQGDNYRIELFHPFKEGDRFRLEGQGAVISRRTVMTDGKTGTPEERETRFELKAIMTVLAVDTVSRPKEQSYIVSELVRITGNERKRLLSNNSKVVAKMQGGKTTYLVDTHPPKGELEGALLLMCPLDAPGPTDQELFGTEKSVSAGQSWPINSDLLTLAFIENMGLAVSNVTGVAKFRSIEGSGTNKIAVVDVSVHCARELPVPSGYRLLSSEDTMVMTTAVPLGRSAPFPFKAQIMTSKFVATRDSAGTASTLEGSVTTKAQFKISPF